MKPDRVWILPLLLAAALSACARQNGEESAAEGADDLAGYYVYSDPARGAYSLALLDNNRFLMVFEAAEDAAAMPAPPGEDTPPAAGGLGGMPQGVVGWYVLRGDRIHLSSDAGVDAEGVVKGEIIRLEFGGGLPETYTPDEDFGLPFQKWRQQPEESQKTGSGGEEEGGQKEGGG